MKPNVGTVGRMFAILVLAAALTSAYPQRKDAPEMAITADDIGGVVTRAKGPEARVWVIAETNDLPTEFIKIVVTLCRSRSSSPGAVAIRVPAP